MRACLATYGWGIGTVRVVHDGIAIGIDSIALFPTTGCRAKPLIDENTIGVCPILGSTFNGEYEDVKGAFCACV